MKKVLNETRIVFILLFCIFILFFLLSYFSEGTYDGGDGIKHYLISRFSWKHPEQFLYSWGKPFFTLISSPFSQFGLFGINVFNIFCAIGSAFICCKIAKKLNMQYAYLVIVFLCFTPCYFPTINSGLTEPFFGFVLIASVYLMLIEKYTWAAILVSILPFVRNEGYFLFPLFFIVLLYRKKYFIILWLSLGTLLYSVIGYFYYKDLLWLINQNPYNGKNKDFYGHGEDLLYFFANRNFIWGTVLTILFITGLLALLFNTIFRKREKLQHTFITEESLLIFCSFAVYFVAHSIMWWKGLANSLGLVRVIAGVIPCSALICLRGFNTLMISILRRNEFIEFGIIGVVSFLTIRSPFKHEYFPYKLDPVQTTIKETGEWFKSSQYRKQKVYYLYPDLGYIGLG